MKQIGDRLEIDYLHCPSLGVPSDKRTSLSDMASRAELLDHYEQTTLIDSKSDVAWVGNYMKCQPSVLVCVEKTSECCHRSRLARAIANDTGLEVKHL